MVFRKVGAELWDALVYHCTYNDIPYELKIDEDKKTLLFGMAREHWKAVEFGEMARR
jgi:hypothetical protein